jgi:uncharacterized membrane protein
MFFARRNNPAYNETPTEKRTPAMTIIIVALLVAAIAAIITNYFNQKKFARIVKATKAQTDLDNYNTFKAAWDAGVAYRIEEASTLALMTNAINQ